MPSDDRLARARDSLEGLSVGDGFGDKFFMHADMAAVLTREHALPAPPWLWTDDTNMALSIYKILREHGEIDQDALAHDFAVRYDSRRGYGPAMHRLLWEIGRGVDWRQAAGSLFNWQGSYGNGAAMRIAPLGAYFADDIPAIIVNAERSAIVTHTHPEGIAGAVGVAVAAGLAASWRGQTPLKGRDFLDAVLQHLPHSEVASRVRRLLDIKTTHVTHIISIVGNGYQISAQDTVPFTLWCAAQHLDNYEEALWLTGSGLGDVDTNCAIVGGIVASYVGSDGIPAQWRVNREPLPGLDEGQP